MKHFFTTALILLLVTLGIKQKPINRFEAVGFYNLDNFFDTINDPKTDDEDYLPYGLKRWTGQRYRQKLERMAFAISQIAVNDVSQGMTALGVCEVENRNVLEDLITTPPLNDQQWDFVHYDSPDRRGLDVAFLYQRDRFELISSQSIPVAIGSKILRTRNQLLITGRLGGEVVHFIVAHYPQRGNCEQCTRPFRVASARVTRDVVNFLRGINPDAKIIIMGDFGDNPNSYSILNTLGAKKSIGQTHNGDIFNASYPLFVDGARSVFYHNRWHLFDQQMVSHSLLQGANGLKLYQSTVFNAPFLVDKYTRGRPSYTAVSGFSKHYPTYLVLINENYQTLSKKQNYQSQDVPIYSRPTTYKRKTTPRAKPKPQPKTSTKRKVIQKDTAYTRYIFGQEQELIFPLR